MFCTIQTDTEGLPIDGSYEEVKLWVTKYENLDLDCTELMVADNVHRMNITVRIANLFDMNGKPYTIETANAILNMVKYHAEINGSFNVLTLIPSKPVRGNSWFAALFAALWGLNPNNVYSGEIVFSAGFLGY